MRILITNDDGIHAPGLEVCEKIARDISPPDAVSRSGAAGTPGFGAIANSTRSAPAGPSSSRGSSEISNAASSIASWRSSASV